MGFKSKKEPNYAKLADNLNDLCLKIKTAIDKKKDLKANKFTDLYKKCSSIRNELEKLCTKLLDENNHKAFDYIADILHKNSKILNNFEKLTNRPSHSLSISNNVNNLPSSNFNYSNFNSLDYNNTFGKGLDSDVEKTVQRPNVSSNIFSKSDDDEDVANERLCHLESKFKVWDSQKNKEMDDELNRMRQMDYYRRHQFEQEEHDNYSDYDDWANFDNGNNLIPSSKVESNIIIRDDSHPDDLRMDVRSRLPVESTEMDDVKYKKDYLDTNMDTNIDHFNTSKDYSYDHYSSNEYDNKPEVNRMGVRDRDNYNHHKDDDYNREMYGREDEKPVQYNKDKKIELVLLLVDYIKLLEKCLLNTKYDYLITNNTLNVTDVHNIDLNGLKYNIGIISNYLYNSNLSVVDKKLDDVMESNSRNLELVKLENNKLPQLNKLDKNDGVGYYVLSSNELYGKSIEPLWRCENDGGISNYLAQFLLNYNKPNDTSNNYHDSGNNRLNEFENYRELLKTNKYTLKLNIDELNRNNNVLNLRILFVSYINISSLYMYYNSMNNTNNQTNDDSRLIYNNNNIMVNNNVYVNVNINVLNIVEFPMLVVKLIENDGNINVLKLRLPIGSFILLIPLKYKLNKFELLWNSMNYNVNRVIKLYLSNVSLDIYNLINLLWCYFSVYIHENVILITSCGNEILLGSIYIKNKTLVVIQLRSISMNLINNTIKLLKELFSVLNNSFNNNLYNYLIKKISDIPLKFQNNIKYQSTNYKN